MIDTIKNLIKTADILILALEGAMRRGYTPKEVIYAMVEKQNINLNREWPNNIKDGEPTEHLKG